MLIGPGNRGEVGWNAWLIFGDFSGNKSLTLRGPSLEWSNPKISHGPYSFSCKMTAVLSEGEP